MSYCLHTTSVCRVLSFHTRNIPRYFATRNLSSPDIGKTIYQALKGRDLLSFDGYTRNDVFSLLWVAVEIKLLKEQPLPSRGKRICLIWSDPVTKASVSNASHTLDASLCSIHEDQLQKSSDNLEMLGRSLAAASDIVLVDVPSWNHYHVERFATGCTCPVVVISSQEFSPAIAYSEMLTLFEKYGFLRRLVITCISAGSNNAMLNTYLSLLPIIGMHLRYVTYGASLNQSSSSWEKGLKLSIRNNTEMKQFENISDALYRSHCLSTCSDITPDVAPPITLKSVKEMDLDWTLLQYDSLKGLSVSRDFLRASEHNLIFNTIENQSWIFQALVLAHTSDYAPSSSPPRFEGVD